MLSRLALRRVQALPALTHATQVMSSSSSSNDYLPDYAKTIPWERPKRLMNSPKVRMGFIPDDWFTFFYPKTGVTGPYMFGIGVITFLFSKELYVLEHEFYTGCSLAIVLIALTKKFGPDVSAMLEKELDQLEADLQETRDSQVRQLNENIDFQKKEQWRSEMVSIISEAKKEAIKLQLEAEYRARQAKVYSEVKKRLDYQLLKNNIERQIEQKHMVQWIVDSVKSAITPDLEKTTLQMCIKDLQSMAAANKA